MDVGRVVGVLLWYSVIVRVSTIVIPIDNEVLSEPSIDCEVDSIVARFRTRRPFYGRLFVKGHSANSQCLLDFAARSFGNTQDNNATIRVRYGTCDVRRERSVSPRGVHMYSTIVVQFHSVFVTKVDRSYRLSCFYKEAVQTVTNALEVSVLTTGNLVGNFDMPVCSYSLRQETSNGPLVRYAKVGDRVVHRWECQSPGIEGKDNPYGMLVHSCVVDDGRGNKVTVVDDHGCAIDPYILGHLSYHDDLLLAYREAHVFKFADQNTLAFSCQIRLCVKAVDACTGMTPPKCLPLKNKREAVREGVGNPAPLAVGPYVDAHFVVQNWTTLLDNGAGKIISEKVVCFNGSTDCLSCQYDLRIDRSFTPAKTSSTPVFHSWHCRPAIANAFHRHHSLLLHSCFLSESGQQETQLLDENGCELNAPELHDLTYDGEERSVAARGELERVLGHWSLACQLRLCSKSDWECQVKLSRCGNRVERSYRGMSAEVDNGGEDVDVATDRLLVFDTDDLAGLSLIDIGSEIGDAPMCLSYASAAILLGSTILLFMAMVVSCFFFFCCRSRRGNTDARSVQALRSGLITGLALNSGCSSGR